MGPPPGMPHPPPPPGSNPDQPARFRPRRKIVPLQEMEDIRDATVYLSEARRLLEESREKIDQMNADSHRQGLEEGLSEARENLWPEIEKCVQDVRESIAMSEDDMAEIVRYAVEMIIGEFNEREKIYRILKEALARTVENTSVAIEVAATDLAIVREEIARLRLQGQAPTIRSIDADPALRDGEIVILTPQGRIHVGFRYQLDRLIEGLKKGA
jgi:flagellar biosynthesis/type III secretory pathway protein FliH